MPYDYNFLDEYNRYPRADYIILNGPFPHYGRSGSNAITFNLPDALVRLPQWQARDTGSLAFKFKTTEPNGLLLFNGGRIGRRDFVSVEMHDGILYFVIDMGDGVYRYPFHEDRLNDGFPHEARIDKNGNAIRLHLDSRDRSYTVPGTDTNLDLGTFLYVGGVERADYLPWHIWTRMPYWRTQENKYYVGCVWDLSLDDGDFIDLPAYIEVRTPHHVHHRKSRGSQGSFDLHL